MFDNRFVQVVCLALVLTFILVSCKSKDTPILVSPPSSPNQTVVLVPVASPINHPPHLEPLGDKTVAQASLLEFQVRATDLDGDLLTYSAGNLPPGATFNVSTSTFSWVPQAAGFYPDVLFSVSDGQLSDLQTISITVLRIMPTALPQPSNSMLPLALFFYGAHTPAVDSRIITVRPQYTVINSLHGLWGSIYSSNALQDVFAYHASGIKVIGYITSGYEGTGSAGKIDPQWYTLEMNQKFIKNMAEIDRVDGVFIDECTSFPDQNSRNYLKTLTDLAHSYGLITWGNVGLAQFDSWFFTQGGFDLMQSDENWRGQDLSPVQRDWGYRISVTGSNPAYTVQDAYDLTTNAWRKGLAYCYISNTGYESLPAWFEEYANSLQKYLVPSNS
jgi:hypothetical protein